MVTSSCVVTVPTSLTCCKARLVTKVLSFSGLHNKYIAKVVINNEIITATNRKTPTMKLLEKKFVLGNFHPCYHAFQSNQKFLSCDYTSD